MDEWKKPDSRELARIERIIHLTSLDEATLERVWKRLAEKETAFALLSAFQREGAEDRNVMETILLAARIRELGYGYYWLQGTWTDTLKGSNEVEDVLFVIGHGANKNEKMRRDLLECALAWNQSAFLLKPAGEEKVRMVLRDGSLAPGAAPASKELEKIFPQLRPERSSSCEFHFERAGVASSNLSKFAKSREYRTKKEG